LFLNIIGDLGSSILIKADIIIISGDSIINANILTIISNNRLITLHHNQRGVFFNSITAILFIRLNVVLLLVISKEFVIYLYLIQNILE